MNALTEFTEFCKRLEEMIEWHYAAEEVLAEFSAKADLRLMSDGEVFVERERMMIVDIQSPDPDFMNFHNFLIGEVSRGVGIPGYLIINDGPKEFNAAKAFAKIGEYMKHFEPPKDKQKYVPYGHTTRPPCPKKIRANV